LQQLGSAQDSRGRGLIPSPRAASGWRRGTRDWLLSLSTQPIFNFVRLMMLLNHASHSMYRIMYKRDVFSSFFHSKAVSNRPCKVIFYNYLFEEFKFKIKNEIRIIMPVNQDNSPCLASSMKLTTSAKAAGWLCAQSARRSPAFIPYIHAWYVRTVYATSSLLKRASGW
jgi:hypothetical protein